MSLPSRVDSHLLSRRVFGYLMGSVGAWIILLFLLGKLAPQPQFDTDSYLDYPLPLSSESLQHSRTIVYPVLLAMLGRPHEKDPWILLPWVQYAVWGLAVLYWFHSLRKAGWDPWTAFFCAIPLLTSSFVWTFGSHLTPDLLALGFALLTISCWLQLTCIQQTGGSSVMLLMGCTVFCCLSYQTKPAYLFLLPLLPIGGWIARWWLNGLFRDAYLVFLRLAIVAWAPFLLWCTARWMLVGHFGLVSFGGYNIIGIAGQLLQDDWVAELSDNDRDLAISILARREERKDWVSSTSYEAMETQFNGMVWQIAVPEALALSENRSDEANRRLAALSRSILWNHPYRYGEWLLRATKHAILEVLEAVRSNPLTWISCLTWLTVHSIRWKNRQRHDEGPVATYSEGVAPIDSERHKALRKESDRLIQTLIWLGLGFCVAKLGLVILVEPPIERYAGPAALFLQLVVPCLCWRAMIDKKSVAP